jgi:hypothetical protein
MSLEILWRREAVNLCLIGIRGQRNNSEDSQESVFQK